MILNAGLRTGHEQVAGYFESFGGAVEVAEFEPQKFFSQNDMVVVLGYYAREMKKPLVIYRELLYIPLHHRGGVILTHKLLPRNVCCNA